MLKCRRKWRRHWFLHSGDGCLSIGKIHLRVSRQELSDAVLSCLHVTSCFIVSVEPESDRREVCAVVDV